MKGGRGTAAIAAEVLDRQATQVGLLVGGWWVTVTKMLRGHASRLVVGAGRGRVGELPECAGYITHPHPTPPISPAGQAPQRGPGPPDRANQHPHRPGGPPHGGRHRPPAGRGRGPHSTAAGAGRRARACAGGRCACCPCCARCGVHPGSGHHPCRHHHHSSDGAVRGQPAVVRTACAQW